MAQIWADGFDHYGSDAVGRSNMLNGAWAELSAAQGTSPRPVVPTFTARTGSHALQFVNSATGTARRVLGANHNELFIAFGLYVPTLPDIADNMRITQFRDASNNNLFSLTLNTDGSVRLRTTVTGTIIVGSTGPVITAGTWHHVEMRFLRHASAGAFELRIDEEVVINAAALALGSVDVAQIAFNQGNVGSTNGFYIDDLIVRDETGDNNNGFEGDLRIATLFPRADTEVNGWTPSYRKKLGTGILDLGAANNSAVSAATNTQLDLGSGDYTIEAFVRFLTRPTTTNKAAIVSRWQESGNLRSYQLYYGGPDIGGKLVFRTSTNGQAGTVTEVHAWPWEPDTNRWYHVAVVRASGENILYIDGARQGVLVTDAATYFASTAALCIGGEMSSATAVIANTGLDGFVDEVRITKGVARYLTDFTPTSVPFGRNTGTDPDFASVVLLAGFDSGIADESSFARTLTARNGAVQHTPDDGAFAFQTINHPTPRDDTHVEASLLFAQGTLTLEDLPTAGETVTLGSEVYRFVNTLADPFDVLIGANEEACLNNLIAAINGDAGEGTIYGTGTTENVDVRAVALPGPQMRAVAAVAGDVGNSLAAAETLADGFWDAAVVSNSNRLAGGADIPGPSEFEFERPPHDTTIIRSVTIVNRSYKTDSGTVKMQVSFVGPGSASDDGAENTLTVNPTYREDIFVQDPDTMGPITPSTLVGARVRLNRTE